jgi:hypothetical protein
VRGTGGPPPLSTHRSMIRSGSGDAFPVVTHPVTQVTKNAVVQSSAHGFKVSIRSPLTHRYLSIYCDTTDPVRLWGMPSLSLSPR